ncbi:aldose 1-epimerase [Conexibacter sp. JD483]|uniref:aldose 1-epimerase n=1 Tax=unclassified Conexibacter TaxID=2627773 RepID=UPI00271C971D|nr:MULTISPECIES: aldose 1-epimerase [unclassified Conexibacter]MDO8188154.1 aldose 1-epimerase [Conexibacter sp. CPCC 205706]MDO8201282.1 aldose 1-epimerase [Conexibacter sp. CPCC 205762]MDR9370446.1 aldose 1-epimerase [Conexibacter sp. JD483]
MHDGFEVVTLASADGLEASFAPRVGMTCCSLRDRGVELLGERFGLAAYASCGLSTGLSLMHPWTNRLSSWRYTAGGTTVRLPVSPLLHTDRWGLPVNGVQSKGHDWHVEDSGADACSAWLEATLAFERPEQLALFPFPHRVHLRIELRGRALSLETRVEATGRVPVPVCFGYRVYVRRDPVACAVVLPRRRQLVTDERMLPTGAAEPRGGRAFQLERGDVRELFALGDGGRVAVMGTGRRLTLEPLAGFPFAQVCTYPEEPHATLEAMTAEPDALSHDTYPVATAARPYHAALRIAVDDAFEPAAVAA